MAALKAQVRGRQRQGFALVARCQSLRLSTCILELLPWHALDWVMERRACVAQPAGHVAACCCCRCPPAHHPTLLPWLQLQEAEQQYAEIYEEYEKGREFFANIESEMHKAQQVRGGGGNALRWCWQGQGGGF